LLDYTPGNHKPEKHRLDKLFFLEKSNSFKIEKIDDKEYILNRFIEEAIISQNRESMKDLLTLVSKFNKFYILHFDKDREKLIRFFKTSVI
jgi:hypothetical protein